MSVTLVCRQEYDRVIVDDLAARDYRGHLAVECGAAKGSGWQLPRSFCLSGYRQIAGDGIEPYLRVHAHKACRGILPGTSRPAGRSEGQTLGAVFVSIRRSHG
jgi:hypothetical protein